MLVCLCTGEQRSDRHQTVSAGAQRQEQGQMEFRDSDHEEVNISRVNFLFLPVGQYGSNTGLFLVSEKPDQRQRERNTNYNRFWCTNIVIGTQGD